MTIPGYDDWKLMTPDEDREARGGELCPFCGAYSVHSCELEEEMGGICPWQENQPDPDMLRDRLYEDRQLGIGPRDEI